MGYNISGTNFFLEKVSVFRTQVEKALGPGVMSMTFPLALKLGSKVDQGMPVAQWITASYLQPDGLLRAAPSGVL